MNFQLMIHRTRVAAPATFAAFAAFATFAMGNFLVPSAQAQSIPREAVAVNPPQPVENDGKIEVLEFFAYGCIHCAQLEPGLAAWTARQPADVKVKRIPATFAARGIDSPPIFYTLEAMGVLEKLHQKIFDAANLENVMLGNPATLNKWLEKQGVDSKKYEEMQRSFSVQTKINRARKINSDYRIESTPSIAVNGRHLLAGGGEALFANIDQLLAIARATSKPVALAAPAVPVAPVSAASNAAPAKKK